MRIEIKSKSRCKSVYLARKKKRYLKVGTWNVRTMCPGLDSADLTNADVRKTAIIGKELYRLKVDIAALQETRLADCGSLKEENYSFYWQGLNSDQPRHHGVGFAISN